MASAAEAIREARLTALHHVFDDFDKNKDGTISVDELGEALRAVGIEKSEEKLRAMIDEVDTDKTGTINFDEFVQLTEKYPDELETYKEEELREVFKVFDKDGNGYISARDLRDVLNNLGSNVTEAEAEEMLRLADFDGDGKINFKEFVTMMTTN